MIRKKQFSLLILLSFVLFPLSAIANAKNNKAEVLVSIPPLYYLASEIMGEEAFPELLLDGTESLHSYSLKPSDAKKIAKAKVVFMIDEELESFMTKALKDYKSSQKQIYLSKADGVKIYSNLDGNGKDVHFWLDIENAKIFAREMAKVLASSYPEHSEKYMENLRVLEEKLNDLEKKTKTTLSPYKKIPFMTFHNGWQYFEKQFALNAKGVVLEDEDIPFSIRQKIALKQKLKDENIACLFFEPQFSQKTIEDIIKDTKVNTETINPLIASGGTYFDLILEATESMVKCFAKQSAK